MATALVRKHLCGMKNLISRIPKWHWGQLAIAWLILAFVGSVVFVIGAMILSRPQNSADSAMVVLADDLRARPSYVYELRSDTAAMRFLKNYRARISSSPTQVQYGTSQEEPSLDSLKNDLLRAERAVSRSDFLTPIGGSVAIAGLLSTLIAALAMTWVWLDGRAKPLGIR